MCVCVCTGEREVWQGATESCGCGCANARTQALCACDTRATPTNRLPAPAFAPPFLLHTAPYMDHVPEPLVWCAPLACHVRMCSSVCHARKFCDSTLEKSYTRSSSLSSVSWALCGPSAQRRRGRARARTGRHRRAHSHHHRPRPRLCFTMAHRHTHISLCSLPCAFCRTRVRPSCQPGTHAQFFYFIFRLR